MSSTLQCAGCEGSAVLLKPQRIRSVSMAYQWSGVLQTVITARADLIGREIPTPFVLVTSYSTTASTDGDVTNFLDFD